MKYSLTILCAALAVLAACKSAPEQPQRYDQVMEQAPDAKPALYVSADDQRYVGAGSGREIHYYSRSKDKTFVIDENTGEVLRTFDSKTPRVKVVEPAPERGEMVEEMPEEGCGCADEGCGCGCAPDEGCGCGCG